MKQKSGFTLIELSVVLAIISVILYGSMSILITYVQTAQVNSTVATMDAIEKALLDYRVAYNRLPCPTDLTATATNANYGIEAANMGSCTGGSPAANFIAASGTAEGGVPVRSLRLPDSFMYDGWGHKFRYAVNPTYTVASVSSPTNAAAITVNDASGTARSTAAIYAIVSHGANGHGAYTSNGSVVNAKSTNADEQTNCHCDNTGAHTGGAGVLSPVTYVQKAPTIATAGSPLTAFDDIVTYKEGWQMMTPNLATNDFVPVAQYYRTVTIDHTKVGTVGNTDQSNFPVLFSGTYSYLATTANGGAVTNANGYDITFTSDAAGHNLLPFERESSNATTGAVNFWVQVPTVSHTADTVIYLQYGNSAITNDQSNKARTWDSNYLGVWHLSDNAANTIVADSTSNANTGGNLVNTSTKTAVGKIASGLTFDGSTDRVLTTSVGTINGQAQVTVSAWVNTSLLNGNQREIYFEPTTVTANTRIALVIYTSNLFRLMGRTNDADSLTNFIENTTALSTSTWYHVVGVYDSINSMNSLMVNGVNQTSARTQSAFSSTAPGHVPTFGDQADGTRFWNGILDEVRISKTARSVDWNTTEYNNQNSPSTFYTVGAQTAH